MLYPHKHKTVKYRQKKNFGNVYSADSTTKHYYSFLEYIASTQLGFGHLISQIALMETEFLNFIKNFKQLFFQAYSRWFGRRYLKFNSGAGEVDWEHPANNSPT